MTVPGRIALAGIAAAVLAATQLVALTPATADPLGSARARATALRQQVDRLRIEAEVATEEYDAVADELAQVVARHLLAERQLDAAAAATGTGRDLAGSRVRALYRSGGQLGLVSSVLGAPTIGAALDGLHNAQHLVRGDAAALVTQRRFQRGAATIAADLAQLAAQQTALEKRAAAGARRVTGLLARQQQLLAGADAQVLRLVEAQRAAAEAAERSRAAALLAGGTLGNAAPSSTAAAALTAARTQLGKPYQWGATGTESFDCSGLTGWAYARAGVALPRTSRQQWFAGRHVALAELAPGDLLFWATDPADPATIHHVALYAGNGLMVAAPHTGARVREQAVYLDGYIGAVRLG